MDPRLRGDDGGLLGDVGYSHKDKNVLNNKEAKELLADSWTQGVIYF